MQVRDCTTLTVILDCTLLLASRIAVDDTREDDIAGVELSSLVRLRDTRAFEGNSTALHFLAKMVLDKVDIDTSWSTLFVKRIQDAVHLTDSPAGDEIQELRSELCAAETLLQATKAASTSLPEHSDNRGTAAVPTGAAEAASTEATDASTEAAPADTTETSSTQADEDTAAHDERASLTTMVARLRMSIEDICLAQTTELCRFNAVLDFFAEREARTPRAFFSSLAEFVRAFDTAVSDIRRRRDVPSSRRPSAAASSVKPSSSTLRTVVAGNTTAAVTAKTTTATSSTKDAASGRGGRTSDSAEPHNDATKTDRPAPPRDPKPRVVRPPTKKERI